MFGNKKVQTLIESGSRSHLITTDGTGIFPFQPLIDALSMEDVVTEEFLEGFFLNKLNKTNSAPKI